MKEIKLFGLRRSGTNYLQLLLKQNYKAKVLTNKGGWKHGKYRVYKELGYEIDCVFISKNIFSWLTSMQRRYAKRHSLIAMIGVPDYVNLWSLIHENWLNVPLKEKKKSFVKYEDLIVDPEKVCVRVAKELNLEKMTPFFKDTKQIVEPMGNVIQKKFDLDYYVGKQYMNNFPRGSIKGVRDMIDLNIVKKLGYNENTLC